MAEATRRDDDDRLQPQEDESSGTERVRSSNDRDQELEREGIESDRKRGHDEAVRGQGDDGSEDVDPDSPEADIDRDDFVTD